MVCVSDPLVYCRLTKALERGSEALSTGVSISGV